MFSTLLVEDIINFRDALRYTIRSHFPDVRVEEAGDGIEALSKIESILPDIVFMDIKLPGDNGIKLTKVIKREYSGIVVVILTSYDMSEYRQAAFRSGADCYIYKGSDSCMNEILARMEGTLAIKGIVLPH